jgi:tetraacyldisaccharide 4'-kinase
LTRSLQQRLEASWSTRGPLAWLLLPLSLLFRCAIALRRGLVLAGLLRSERLPVPVVVVGNLVVGGAGKTPAVIALVTMLRRQGWTPGIVSRGYGRSSDAPLAVRRDTAARVSGDEPLLLHLRTGAPVQVGRDRAAAGRELLRRHPELNILIADDGLQHTRLARDAQLIVFDERGAGNGLLLPAGPLREPLAREAPPRSVVVYNAPAASTTWPGGVAHRGLAGAAPLAAWWAGEAPSPSTLAALCGRPVLAVAGVARPSRFFAMLRGHGLQIDELALPDHFPFQGLPWPAGTSDVILTEKDAVKLPPTRQLGATRVWVATLDFRLDPASEAALLRLLPSPPEQPEE